MAAYADHDELLWSLQSRLRVWHHSQLVAPLLHRMMIVHDALLVGADRPHLKREPFLLYLLKLLAREVKGDELC